MYDILLAAINAKFPDNNQELITPEWARDAFLYAVQSLGIKSDFRGLAPLACPEATPDEKCWYITDHDQTLSADVEFTGYGANKTVRKGEQWMVYWDGSQWEWLFLGSSFVNLNYGVNSLTKMLIPATSTPYDEDNPRTFYFLSDASAADYIVRLILDGESVEVADYVTLYDSNAHTLFIEFDAHYGAYTPTCFDGVAAGIVTLPMGVSRFSAGVGIPTTVVGLPDTINYIDADAITSTNASSIQLMGAPPKLDGDIDWSYISMLILPYQYKMLYSANADWQAAVDAIITAGGSVYLDDTTTYDPTDDHATDSQAGIVELATDGEAQAGTDTSKAVTPHGLSSALANLNIDDQSIDGRNEYRTLTKDEWDYLLNTRPASTVEGVSDARFAKAKVNDVNGLVIFPDTFYGGSYTWANINNKASNFTGNTITEAQWAKIETAGAVFLPCCGQRNNTTVSNVSGIGNYRCADRSGTGGNYLNFFSSNINLFSGSLNYFGYGVRLANTSRKGFTIGVWVEVGITRGNLQYKASTDEWRFAPKAWIVVGNGNANIGENYNGWIDLFGYGTSGWSGSGAGAYQPWASDSISTYCAYDLTGDYDRADWGVWISRKIHADELPTATDTAKGVVELATSAEAEAGTDTERVLTPKTNRDAHDAWHWFGTQAEFDALSPNYDANVIYHVEQGYTIPQPTVADAGKLLSVSALGDYELITIVNSELVEY